MEKKKVNFEEVVKEKSFFEKNWKTLCAALAAVIVLVCLFVGYKKLYAEPKEEAASEALATCHELYKQGNYEQALNGDGQCKGLLSVANQYGGTEAGNLAQAYIGVCYYNLGKYDEAVKALEAFSPCSDTTISPAALAALGNSYACQKQYDKAVSKLVEAAEKANSCALSPVFLLQAGELYELALDNKAKAVECYKKVKENYAASTQVKQGMVDAYIERASVK